MKLAVLETVQQTSCIGLALDVACTVLGSLSAPCLMTSTAYLHIHEWQQLGKRMHLMPAPVACSNIPWKCMQGMLQGLTTGATDLC